MPCHASSIAIFLFIPPYIFSEAKEGVNLPEDGRGLRGLCIAVQMALKSLPAELEVIVCSRGWPSQLADIWLEVGQGQAASSGCPVVIKPSVGNAEKSTQSMFPNSKTWVVHRDPKPNGVVRPDVGKSTRMALLIGRLGRSPRRQG